jgi:hypothetical protein
MRSHESASIAKLANVELPRSDRTIWIALIVIVSTSAPNPF